MDNYTTYPSNFMVVAPNGIYSKHYYMGTQRIASRIGDGNATIFEDKSEKMPDLKSLQQNDMLFYFSKKGFQSIQFEKYEDPGLNDSINTDNDDDYIKPPSIAIYYYHPDHLGTNTIVTNMNGNIYQYFLNLPFGETMAEQTSSGYFQSPWKFNGKELDAETGLYYYGARYYYPRLSNWLNVDPLAEEKPWTTPYHYCSNNPLNRTDPNGMFDIKTGKIEKGDNLTKITKQINHKYGTNLSINDIAKANNIENVNKIQVGNTIALPGQNSELSFDLQSLKVTDATYNIDIPGLSWQGTSGRAGYQSPEFQNVENKGPIPEGSYLLGETQSYSSTSIFDKFKGVFGRGTWRGGTNAWGEYRTWLTPMEGTNTFGRSGFSIHGGTTPGSAGCIDLTGENNSFHNWLKSYGKPIRLNVRY